MILSNKLFLWLLGITAIILIGLQLFSSYNLFIPQKGSNTTSTTTSDKVLLISAINANILVPTGFRAEFAIIDQYTVEGSIVNNDIEFFIKYSNTEAKRYIGIDSGAYDPLQKITIKDETTDLIKTLYRLENTDFFRPKIFDTKVIQYTEIVGYDEKKDEGFISGNQKLSILERGSVLSNGSVAKIRLINPSLSDSQKNNYLQLADKILLSIKAQ